MSTEIYMARMASAEFAIFPGIMLQGNGGFYSATFIDYTIKHKRVSVSDLIHNFIS